MHQGKPIKTKNKDQHVNCTKEVICHDKSRINKIER
jgi:hypothetical protein